MDFFSHQEDARRKTRLLVFYYGLAVALILVSVYLVLVIGLGAAASGEEESVIRWWNPQLFLSVSVGLLALIGAGTLYKIHQLAQGGEFVARSLGGRRVDPATTDVAERRLLNVVEEMAIASGAPVPPVFVMEEKGINAFAAGMTPSDAVIGVTRGCLETLTRDELQGVMAHEFSHILQGDMRLNLRLMGVLHGILLIALAGYFLFRSSLSAPRSRSRENKDGGGLRFALVLLGLALLVIGYIGVVFSKLIKSAVSRQREFLADASAVQYTRNPSGIAGALRRIAGYSGGSRILSPEAEEASHLFFANSLSSAWAGLLATHPPLSERIRRIDAAVAMEIAAAEKGASRGPIAEGSRGPVAGFAGS
ncbi:MAG: M48 family metallopeptidase, partial [Kiritimatiellia bacterium]|nr:M48 family metallopeptidase [Kiritimatiellia bacterium]